MSEEIQYIDGLFKVCREEYAETFKDILNWGMSVTKISEQGIERIDPMSKQGCTIRYQAKRQEQIEALSVGEIVRLSNSKRVMGEITESIKYRDEQTIKLSPVYKPAPKSTLKNKSPFSKNKFKLIQ